MIRSMKSTAERIELLGLGTCLSQDFLFDWRQRSRVLNFLAEKCVTEKPMPEMVFRWECRVEQWASLLAFMTHRCI